MSTAIFDHEKLDVYRLSIEYFVTWYDQAKALKGAQRHLRDQWLRAAQSIPLNIAEGIAKHSLNDKRRYFEIARGSAMECAAVHDILCQLGFLDANSTNAGKEQLRRIVSMLTRLIQKRTISGSTMKRSEADETATESDEVNE